ncbi:Uncharacterised protein [Pragia fontium]|uniref:WG repeat-containing protein n=1 Tax=Pragia fontium TaxID=82985 RepID=UPI000DFC810D|nr:WG repeat-containing protein [Pragia fontium]SUB81769.1 Uncharacterised protein [Pragia fontium]
MSEPLNTSTEEIMFNQLIFLITLAFSLSLPASGLANTQDEAYFVEKMDINNRYKNTAENLSENAQKTNVEHKSEAINHTTVKPLNEQAPKIQPIPIMNDTCSSVDCSTTFLRMSVNSTSGKSTDTQHVQFDMNQPYIDYSQGKKTIETLGIQDFVGQLTHQNTLSIKLPVGQSIREQKSGTYYRWFDSVYIDIEDETTHVYHSNNDDLCLISTISEKSLFDFDSWLSEQTDTPEAVIYRENNGAIYYNTQGQLTAFYYTYSQEAKRYTFAETNIPDHNDMADIAKKYAVLRTLSPENTGTLFNISAAEIEPTQFKQRYGSLYNIQNLEQRLRQEITKSLQLTHLLVQNNAYSQFSYSHFPLSEMSYATIKVSKGDINAAQQVIIDRLSTEYNHDRYKLIYRSQDALVIEDKAYYNNYHSYYFIYDSGLTYQIKFDPGYDDSSLYAHIDFIHSLRLLSPIQANPYSSQFIADHLYRYYRVEPVQGTPDNLQHYKIFTANGDISGIIDATGKMIIPAKYRQVRPTRSGYLVTNQMNQQGFISYQGEQLLDDIYEKISDYKNGLLFVAHRSQGLVYKGLYDSYQQRLVFPIEYIEIQPVTQGADTLTLRKIIPTSIERDNQNRITGYNSLIGLGDIRGKILQPCVYEWLSYDKRFNAILVKKKNDDKFGTIKLDGTISTSVKHDSYQQSRNNNEIYFMKTNAMIR